MPPVLTPALPAIAFSKNTLWAKVQSTDYLVTPPVKAVNSISFGAAVAAAASYTIAWTGAGVVMTASDAPDDSGNQFPSGDGGAAYVTGLVDWFQGNFFIDQAYIITADTTGTPKLIFTAKVFGVAYNFNPAVAPLAIVTAGADNTPVSNFMHHIEVWIASPDGSAFYQTYSANVPLDEPLTGITSVDIHEALHSFLTSDRPELAAPYSQCFNSIRQYFIKFASYLGDTPAVQKIQNGPIAYINKGGLAMQPSLLRNIKSELYPVPGDNTKNRFMRQGSINKLVTKEQPEWLTFLNLTGGLTHVALLVAVYNSDGSSFSFEPAAVSIDVYQKFQFPVGYNQLNIDGQLAPGAKPVYYTVALNTGAHYVTDIYAFVIDYNYRQYPKYIVYENSYGAFQTIATVGKGQPEYDRTKTDVQLTTDRSTAAMVGEFVECNITFQDKNTVNIGYDRSGQRVTQLLRDLVASHCIFLWNNGTLIPIGLNTKNLKDYPDGANVYANTLEYYPLYQEEVYTEDLAAVLDDSLAGLISEAGSPVTATVPPVLTDSGTIVVNFGDVHLGVDGSGNQTYTASLLAGLTGYRVSATQLGENDLDIGPFLRSSDIAYNAAAGSFTILIPGFTLNQGDQLIIFPKVLNPDLS